MSKCEHVDFDEYFEKCPDCGIDLNDLIQENFRNELQEVYRNMQQALGIDTGDVAPEQLERLETKEQELAQVVADWLESARGL